MSAATIATRHRRGLPSEGVSHRQTLFNGRARPMSPLGMKASARMTTLNADDLGIDRAEIGRDPGPRAGAVGEGPASITPEAEVMPPRNRDRETP